MKYIVLSKKEFREKWGPTVGGMHYTTEEGEHVVEVPQGASTTTRTHEFGHEALGHENRDVVTYGEYARREIGAHAWAFEKLGREATYGDLVANFYYPIRELFGKGHSSTNVFAWLKDALEDEGYTLDREDRSDLWWWVRDLHKKYQEGRK